jgi:Family of unknown function (DUF5681)
MEGTDMSDGTENESKDNARYQVGYGKPPKNTQFKPGQSGNPRGRKAISGNIWNEARSAFAKPMRVKEGKTTKTVSTAEAYVRKKVSDALRGDWKAFNWVLQRIETIKSLMPRTDAQDQSGTLVMPWEFFSKSPAEKKIAIRKEAARRNDLLARGLPYTPLPRSNHGGKS